MQLTISAVIESLTDDLRPISVSILAWVFSYQSQKSYLYDHECD